MTFNPPYAGIGLGCGEIGYNFVSNRKNRHKNRALAESGRVPKNHIHLLLCPAMDYLWTPWRYAYVTNAEKTPGCIFCEVLKAGDDEKVRIAYRGQHCFVILNTYPYTPGHVMIVPYAHLDELQKLPAEAAQEMMVLSQRMEGVLRDLYKPDGVNLGMNIGKAAGAGVAGHIHMHALPRWVADANFVSVIGETRTLPEALEVTWRRIREALNH
jgi:ATP adenylyltransferase